MTNSEHEGRSNEDYEYSDVTPELRELADKTARTQRTAKRKAYTDISTVQRAQYSMTTEAERLKDHYQQNLARSPSAADPEKYSPDALKRVDEMLNDAHEENKERDQLSKEVEEE